jgi:hypothetical protein
MAKYAQCGKCYKYHKKGSKIALAQGSIWVILKK